MVTHWKVSLEDQKKGKIINSSQTFPDFLVIFRFILLDNIDSILLYIFIYMTRGCSLFSNYNGQVKPYFQI